MCVPAALIVVAFLSICVSLQVYQELRRNVSGNAQGGGANMGELDLTLERVAAAVDALAEEKLLFVARSKAITIHESITHTF